MNIAIKISDAMIIVLRHDMLDSVIASNIYQLSMLH